MFDVWVGWMILNCKSVAIFFYIIFLYWVKEIMEYALRVVYGVDRRMMYVPVAQNVRADLPFLGNVRMYQRGELFYYVFHSVVSVCLAILGFVAARYTYD